MTKYVGTIVLKFKINTINSQRDIGNLYKYFLLEHESIITKIFFQDILHCSMGQLLEKKKKKWNILKFKKDTRD